jgi:hypothetical protein
VVCFALLKLKETFFGMNTREINSSAWPLRHYFITALPLAVLTVIVPLYFTKAVAFLARKMQGRTIITQFLAECLLGISFVLNIVTDGLWAVRNEVWGINMFLFMYFFFFSLSLMVRAAFWSYKARPNLATILYHLLKQRLETIKFFLVLFFWVAFYTQPFVEILLYVIYYLNAYITWSKRKDVTQTV